MDSCTASVTGALSALKHPDPLKADMQKLSVALTQPCYFSFFSHENIKEVQRKLYQPSVSALVRLVRASQI